MSFQIIKQIERKARKEYHCDCTEYIRNWIDGGLWTQSGEKVTFAELRLLVIARREHFMIMKGTTYIHQVYKFEGDGPYTNRCRKDMFELCVKYDLFQE